MVKKKNGRPTVYLEEYDDLVEKHMASGLSFESFGATPGVCKDTLYEWVKKHQSFADAKKRGMIKCREWWEKQGQLGLWESGDKSEKKLNATIWLYNMKCRFPDDWREKSEIKQQTTHSVDNKDALLLAELVKELIELKKE